MRARYRVLPRDGSVRTTKIIARAMARGLGFVTPCPNKQGMLEHWRDKHTQPEEVEDALPVDTREDVKVGAEVCEGPTKVANNSPSPHPPLQKREKYNFWRNYMLLA